MYTIATYCALLYEYSIIYGYVEKPPFDNTVFEVKVPERLLPTTENKFRSFFLRNIKKFIKQTYIKIKTNIF